MSENHLLSLKQLVGFSAQYLARREHGPAAILDGWRPLGGDAHFHIAERLPGRVQQHIAGQTQTSFTQKLKAKAA